MQEYLQKTRLSAVLDELGFHILSLLACFLWFFAQWGVRLSAVAAGLALYVLVLLLRKKIRDGRVARREEALRRAIGGELALERLCLEDAAKAHFETAVLLSLRYPLTLLRTGEEGTLCALKGKKLLLFFLQAPEKSQVSAAQVLSLQRSAKQSGADWALLCAPCGVSKEAREQAQAEPGVFFLSRDTLISVFGSANPAQDAQLLALKSLRKKRISRHLEPAIFHPKRAGRYAFYGALLLAMYLFTHLPYYAVPGMICVFMAAFCRCARRNRDELREAFSL